jgi:hypothetical protein
MTKYYDVTTSVGKAHDRKGDYDKGMNEVEKLAKKHLGDSGYRDHDILSSGKSRTYITHSEVPDHKFAAYKADVKKAGHYVKGEEVPRSPEYERKMNHDRQIHEGAMAKLTAHVKSPSSPELKKIWESPAYKAAEQKRAEVFKTYEKAKKEHQASNWGDGKGNPKGDVR